MLSHFTKLHNHSRVSVSHSLKWLMRAHGEDVGSRLSWGCVRVVGVSRLGRLGELLGPGDVSPVHHPRWWITAIYIYISDRHCALRPSWRGPDRADRPRERPSPRDSVIFSLSLSHSTISSAILVHWTQPFCCNELDHFTLLNSVNFAIFLSYFMILLQYTQSFCDLVSHFAIPNSAIFGIVFRSVIFL
jgi:hypothetical protein